MIGWKKVRLGDCCEITSSKRIFYSDYVESGVPFYRSKEIIESFEGVRNFSETLYITEERYNEIRSRFGVPSEGDLLLTSVGTIGVPYLVKRGDRFYFKDGNLTWFRNFEKTLDSKFLFYWLQTNQGKGELDAHTIGSSQKALTIRGLKEVSIRLPDIEQQQRMISILSDFDLAIDNARRQIALLEEAAMRLYREWFVVKANPKWEKKTFGTFAKVARGRVITKATAHRGEVPVVAAGLSPAYFTEKANVKAPSVTISASGANAGYVWYHANDIWASNCSYLSKNETPYVYFSYAFLKTHSAVLKGLQKGSAQPHVHGSDIEGISFFVPGDDLVRQYEITVDPVFQKIGVNEKLITSLTEARDRLLPKLMSGEIEV